MLAECNPTYEADYGNALAEVLLYKSLCDIIKDLIWRNQYSKANRDITEGFTPLHLWHGGW